MDAPRALVFRPLVKGNEALGTRLWQRSLFSRKRTPGKEPLLAGNLFRFFNTIPARVRSMVGIVIFFFWNYDKSCLAICQANESHPKLAVHRSCSLALCIVMRFMHMNE